MVVNSGEVMCGVYKNAISIIIIIIIITIIIIIIITIIVNLIFRAKQQ